MTRAEKVAYAQRRRAEGAIAREIAAEMGCARSTVETWLCDPDLSKQRARRESYRGGVERGLLMLERLRGEGLDVPRSPYFKAAA